MTTITLPRATVEQALDFIVATNKSSQFWLVPESNLNKTVTALRAALAQQAEPVEPGAWVASKDGRVIYDNTSKDDGLLRVSGDFENDEQRIRYAKQIVDKLNAALAQQDGPVLVQGELPPRYVARSPIQTEPVEPVAWRCACGANLYLDEYGHPASRAAPRYGKPQQAEPVEPVATLTAQRDALLEALKGMRHKYGEYACSVCDHADAVIKTVEEGK